MTSRNRSDPGGCCVLTSSMFGAGQSEIVEFELLLSVLVAWSGS